MTAQTPAAGRFAPSVLDPQDVDFVLAWDSGDESWWKPSAGECAAMRVRLAPEAKARTGGFNRCTMCGAHLRYVVVATLISTGELFVVGEECADSLSIAAQVSRKVSDLRANAKAKRENMKAAARADAYLEANPTVADAFTLRERSGFLADVWSNLRRYGSLTDAQEEAVVRVAGSIREADARREAEKNLPVVPVIEGRVTVTGTVLTTKVQNSIYGETLKMLVRDDRGFKVWGTVPAALAGEGLKGARVTFTATVERSRDDEAFGFYKRPNKAQRVA